MIIKRAIIGMAVLLILAACQKEELPEADLLHLTSEPTEQANLLKANSNHALAVNLSQGVRNFRAHLSGQEEVPPVETQARGQAVFQLSRDGEQLSFRVIVSQLYNVTMGHIHLAPAGENGPVVAWLYPASPPPQLIPGPTNGVLATGVITADDLVGPLAGATMADLAEYLVNGGAYVNIHTEQYPAGEIRGQIK
jgi:hypothetical protein